MRDCITVRRCKQTRTMRSIVFFHHVKRTNSPESDAFEHTFHSEVVAAAKYIGPINIVCGALIHFSFYFFDAQTASPNACVKHVHGNVSTMFFLQKREERECSVSACHRFESDDVYNCTWSLTSKRMQHRISQLLHINCVKLETF